MLSRRCGRRRRSSGSCRTTVWPAIWWRSSGRRAARRGRRVRRRSRGAGRRARGERQEVVTLECRGSNTVALRLYEKYGFQRLGLRPRYYSDNHEDAYVLTVGGIEATAYGRRFGRLREEHRAPYGDYGLVLQGPGRWGR